jgi:hypothetical protein
VDGEVTTNSENQEKVRSGMRSIRSKILVSSTELGKGHNKVWQLDQDILMGNNLRKKAYKEGRKAHERQSPQYGRQSVVGILYPAGAELP